VRIGITLPSFRSDAGAALDAARQAEVLGLHGVFVFDHLWPLGQPERPALSAFPLLGAVAAVTNRIALGTLVARVGLVPDDVLLAELLSLERLAPGRLVAGLGTGDSKSAPENLAYGIAYTSADHRRLQLRAVGRRLRDAGVPVWVGGGSPATSELAADLGVALNLWGAQPSALAAVSPRTEVTWAGPVPAELSPLLEWLGEIDGAGAMWAVCAWPVPLEVLAEAGAMRGDLDRD
jgi:alkanesulfonate monooxygenase SsuD/methylene tetrahydromethanopterin reductase-like flavin-dependent oxidoreductase (luciferase family)